ncbi:MAG TPA: hypothetical protein VMB85_01330 [Bryobacteraceae bacterium]|nr:hypothetical protein [Bryobacteraceae bacterium]
MGDYAKPRSSVDSAEHHAGSTAEIPQGRERPRGESPAGAHGRAVLAKESYDHWVRDHSEFERIRIYIENNPVKAGLARSAEEYIWSSAYAGKNVSP